MKLLAIDTTEDACSAALQIDDAISECFELAPRRHSELILPMMDGLLAEAGLALGDLDALAFARGPGSFTGLRIAASVVQGAAFGADLPVVPVSSLQALAQGVYRDAHAGAVLAVFDARMNEVYWGCFRVRQGLMHAVGDEHVSAPQAVQAAGDAWTGAGSGWRAYAGELAGTLGPAAVVRADAMVHARDVAAIARASFADGGGVPAEQALPVYLRNEVAWAKPPPAQT